ncbi:MAG: DUF2254 domain-containing protein [Actinomycetota bacterium]
MIRFRVWAERWRSSQFFIPLALVVAAVVLSVITTSIDARIRAHHVPLPELVLSTVDSARALLGVIASATIAFAGVSISISLLLIQLASSQFSPRVLYGFFRDPVTKWVTGIVIGTFTYCLLVLRVVRAPGETAAPQVVPHISVLLATVLGVGSIVAVVVLINHSARLMQVGEIIRRITDEGRAQIASMGGRFEGAAGDPSTPEADERADGLTVESDDEGWVQLLDVDRLRQALPPHTTCDLLVFVGGFVSLGAPLCVLRPPPEIDDGSGVAHGVRQAIHLGRTRTTQQDVAFVFRQLIDIALRALSPGINDPTTAQEVLVHIGSLLQQLLRQATDPADMPDDRGREVRHPHDRGLDDYVNLAFDQIRLASSTQPAVAITILEVIAGVLTRLERSDVSKAVNALERQARLVVNGMDRGDLLPEDIEAVMHAASSRGLPMT